MSDETWLVVFKNNRVKRDWEELEQRFPSASGSCNDHLHSAPLSRVIGKIFPLRGKPYKGSWEYEVSAGDRVYYFPYLDERRVVIFYAGIHPKKTPRFDSKVTYLNQSVLAPRVKKRGV